MPKSAIEARLLKATKMKQGAKEDRQDFLQSLANAVQDLSDDAWAALGEGDQGDEAQDWANAAATNIKKKKAVAEFSDVGAVSPGASDAQDEDDEPAPKKPAKKAAKPAADEDDDERPSKRKAKPAADEDDEPAPKKKKAAAVEEEDEPAPKKRKAAVADDDEPAPKKPAKKAAVADDEPAPKKKKPAAPEPAAKKPKAEGRASKVTEAKQSGTGIKNSIKAAIVDDMSISLDDLVKKLGKSGGSVSRVTVSNIRAEFRHTIRFLKENAVNVKQLEL